MKNMFKKLVLKHRLKGLKKCGDHVWVGRNSNLQGNIEVGSHISIGSGAQFVSTIAKINIHDYVIFGPNVTIYTGDHAIDILGKHICEITDTDKINRGGHTTKMLQLKPVVG